MAKVVKLDPMAQEVAIQTNDNLMSALLKGELDVLQECGGRGMCSTCHIYVKDGMNSLSPLNRREMRTLEVITTANQCSRLACQARVVGPGVVVQVPEGTYVNQIEKIEDLIGRRAEQDILHPLNGKVVVEKGKLITRTMISQLENTKVEVSEFFTQTRDADFTH